MKPKTVFVLTSALASALLAGPAAAAETYDIDPVHSVVVFRTNHLGFADFLGRFNDISGEFTLDGAKGSVEVEIAASSVDTGNDQRDKHLESPDFLNALQFPSITFKSEKAVKKGDKWTVRGDLTLHGVTRPVEVELEQGRTGEFRGKTRTGFNGSFTIQRSDFGMDYMLEGIGDEIELMLGFEGVRR